MTISIDTISILGYGRSSTYSKEERLKWWGWGYHTPAHLVTFTKLPDLVYDWLQDGWIVLDVRPPTEIAKVKHWALLFTKTISTLIMKISESLARCAEMLSVIHLACLYLYWNDVSMSWDRHRSFWYYPHFLLLLHESFTQFRGYSSSSRATSCYLTQAIKWSKHWMMGHHCWQSLVYCFTRGFLYGPRFECVVCDCDVWCHQTTPFTRVLCLLTVSLTWSLLY